MSDSTRDHLNQMMEYITERLTQMMEAIRKDMPFFWDPPVLPPGTSWDDDGDLVDEEGEIYLDANGDTVDAWELPDACDPHEVLDEYPLEIIDQRGRNFAIVLGTGGPHIEIEAEGYGTCHLVGYWGGEKVSMTNEVYETVMDYFIDRDEQS